MNKKILISLSAISSLLLIYLTLIFCINEFSPLRKMIFLPRKTSTYPKIGNDKKIEIKNNNRTVNGLLSLKGII